MYVSNKLASTKASDGTLASIFSALDLLGPTIEEHAPQNEPRGMLAPELVDKFTELGLFWYFAPKAVGGFELKHPEALQLIERIAYHDGPSAWVLMATGLCISAAGAYLGPSAINALFTGSQKKVIAGQGIPNGRAEKVEGGYRLSGKWNYGSGVKHAHFVHTGAIAYEGGKPRLTPQGMPETLILNVPRDTVKFADNWNVIGLKATGSIDYEIEELFVPEEFCYSARTTTPLRGGSTYTTGTIGIGAVGHTGFAIGQARRALDEVAALARAKAGAPNSIANSVSFQEQFGTMSARVMAARALALECWQDVQAALDRGEEFSTRAITKTRLALNLATRTGVDACEFAFSAAGGVALREGIVQRVYRDMLAGSQHITSSPLILGECGKELAGLAPGRKWGMLSLMDTKTN